MLAGLAGSDTLVGGGGYDNYQFGRGGGRDTIQNGLAGNSGATGELDFGSGIAPDQLWFLQSGNNLLAQIIGSSDQVTVQGWYAANTAQLQEIKTADGAMLDTQLSQLVQAMASYEAANPGFDPTASGLSQAPSDPNLQSAIAAAWHH